jgi:flagellum-specific peptidoglycan hydrolase FlgJ
MFVGSRKEFIEKYGAFIHKVTAKTGILPGTLVAQAFLESSGNGKVGGSKLSREANNFFGIKCGPAWKGDKYNIQTKEYNGNTPYYITACFRKYKSVEDSIKDYVNFLQVNQRYANAGVFKAKTVKEQAEALKRAGYATAPRYAQLVFDVYQPYAGLIDQQKIQQAGIKNYIGLVFLAIGATILQNYLTKKP